MPTLHVLMQWAEGGSLDDFIDIRLGRGSPHVHINPFGAFPSSPNPATSTASAQPPLSRVTTNDFIPVGSDTHSRSARIRAFRAYQRATPEEKERMRHETLVANGRGPGRRAQSLKAVHLLSADEVKGLFRDVVEGLNFLVSLRSSFLRFLCLHFLLAQPLDPTLGFETRERALDLGRGSAYVRSFG